MELFFIVIYIWFSCWMLLESIIFATDDEYNQALISYLFSELRLYRFVLIQIILIPYLIYVIYAWLKYESN